MIIITSRKELKIIGENCTYYNSITNTTAFASLTDSNIPQSCSSCSNWSDEKCAIDVYDSVKNLVEDEHLL